MRRGFQAALAVGAASAMFAASPSARAQTAYLPSNDWRRVDRSESVGQQASPQQFAFELRFGPYFPEVDNKPGVMPTGDGKKPYESVFGDNHQLYFGVEFDYLPIRIPYIGAIGPGLGVGFTTTSAPAKYSSDHTTVSPTTTSFTILPMYLDAVVRLDELMRRTGFPVVPYAKAGVGLGVWTASPVPANFTGAGVTWGLDFAVGGMLALNFLDTRSAARLDETTGVNHSYLFGEFKRADLNGLGSTPKFYLGSTTWVVGLAIDM